MPYLVQGDTRAVESVLAYLKKSGVNVGANPDVYVQMYDTFGIEDAQELRARAHMRGFRTRRVFVLAAASLTPEAQNALLKTFEEPPANAVFFLIVPNPGMLLPTLCSRMQTLALSPGRVAKAEVDVQAFLRAAPEKRLELIKIFLSQGKGEGEEGERARDVAGALTFLADVERALAHLAREGADVREGVVSVLRARKFLTDKGSLMKSLLEQVALLVPRV